MLSSPAPASRASRGSVSAPWAQGFSLRGSRPLRPCGQAGTAATHLQRYGKAGALARKKQSFLTCQCRAASYLREQRYEIIGKRGKSEQGKTNIEHDKIKKIGIGNCMA